MVVTIFLTNRSVERDVPGLRRCAPGIRSAEAPVKGATRMINGSRVIVVPVAGDSVRLALHLALYCRGAERAVS